LLLHETFAVFAMVLVTLKGKNWDCCCRKGSQTHKIFPCKLPILSLTCSKVTANLNIFSGNICLNFLQLRGHFLPLNCINIWSVEFIYLSSTASFQSYQ
jgi:hypothetical protein